MRLGVEAALVEGRLVRGDVEIVGGRIARVEIAPEGRGLAIPGLVDLHVNGFAGVDFLEADTDELRRAARALAHAGVTAFLPTLVTAPPERLVAALTEIAASDAPGIVGAHLEGPFISAERLGAHPASARLDPSLGLLKRLLAAGPVRLVTLAPELPRAHDLIRGLQERELTVSLGHSNATADEANAAFDLGVRTVTHVFNAMRPFAHRDPGIAGAALAHEDVIVQAIFDGVHLAPETEAVLWRATRGRLALVSDHAAVEGGQHPDGTLAGSTATLLDCVRRVHALGAPVEEAVQAATEVPARILGERSIGRLVVGASADVVVLDDRFELTRVLVDGAEML